jgi:hypothetical protein
LPDATPAGVCGHSPAVPARAPARFGVNAPRRVRPACRSTRCLSSLTFFATRLDSKPCSERERVWRRDMNERREGGLDGCDQPRRRRGISGSTQRRTYRLSSEEASKQLYRWTSRQRCWTAAVAVLVLRSSSGALSHGSGTLDKAAPSVRRVSWSVCAAAGGNGTWRAAASRRHSGAFGRAAASAA